MAATGASTFDGRLQEIRGVVESVLADGPATLLDLKRRLGRELSFDPKPQALQALSALRDVSDPKAIAIGSRAAVLHLAIDRSTFELWDGPDRSDAALGCGVAMVAPLLAMRTDVEKAFEETIAAVDRMERDATARLHASLRLPEDPLLAAVVVVPELARLSAAARREILAEAAPTLTSEERHAVVAAAFAVVPSRHERVLLDAIALRTAIERSMADPDAREKLESLRLAHGVVSQRIDALRGEQFSKSTKSDAKLDEARRKLFAAYVNLSKVLTGQQAEIGQSVQEQILDAERAAAAVDRARSATEGLMRDAAAGADRATPIVETAPPDMSELLRERKRKRLLTGIAAGLVPVALTANFITYWGSSAPTTAADLVATAVPVKEVVPIGQALYCQVTAMLWEGLTDAERAQKVTALGKIAGQQGYEAVVVVDENRRELARWSARSGPEAAPVVAR